MSGRFVKVTVTCLVPVGLGISVKPILKRGCSAVDVKKEKGAPAVSAPAPEALPADAPAPSAPSAASAPAGTYDFSDSSHWNLTVSAWEHLAKRDFDGVAAYVKKCLELYEAKAKEMAAGMKSFSRPGHEDDFALVNDVATSHYVMGEAYMKFGRIDEAAKEFAYVIETYPYAQCWDPKGWFWKVSEVSKKNLEKLGKSAPQPAQEAAQ